jgi:hypothetical protein
MDNGIDWWVAVLIMGLVIYTAWIAGSSKGHLSRMEDVAAVHTARTEVGWTYERYRLESLRLDWLNLSPQARAEYTRTWGRPKWAMPSRDTTVSHEEYPNKTPQSQ